MLLSIVSKHCELCFTGFNDTPSPPCPTEANIESLKTDEILMMMESMFLLTEIVSLGVLYILCVLYGLASKQASNL